MDSPRQLPKDLIERLPTEILQEILACLPDINSLKAVSLTCRRLNLIFWNAEEYITTQVLLNHITPAFIHDALAAREASLGKPWSAKREDAQEFFSRYIVPNKTLTLSSRWKLSEALPLAQLHDHVRLVANDIALRSLAEYAKAHGSENTPSAPPSINELNRIQHALYQYEIYCSVLGEEYPPLRPGLEQLENIFDRLSPWENEQLCCVYEYFFAFMHFVLEELGTKDPKWVAYLVNMWDPCKTSVQYQLSRGLHHLGPLIRAASYEERKHIMGDPHKQDYLQDFLNEILGRMMVYTSEEPLFNMDPEELEDYVPPPLNHDPDKGPEDVWRWAHHSVHALYFVFSKSRIPLRKWGYVLWDRERLDSWKILDTPWSEPDPSQLEEMEIVWPDRKTYQLRAQKMVSEGRLENSYHFY